MSGWFSKQEKLTKDEIQELRNLRSAYLSQLTRYQISTTEDIKSNRLSPDTGTLVFKQIKNANTWLEKHPNATVLEITANQDATNEEIQRLLKTDEWKRAFTNAILIFQPVIENIDTRSKTPFTKDQKKQLFSEKDRIESWYKKNNATATQIDFEQEWLTFNTKLKEIVTNQEQLQGLTISLAFASLVPTSKLKADLTEYNKAQQKAKDQQIDYESAPKVIMSTATSTFTAFLIIVLCISAGSVAANMAIGRTPAMRMLYFIYGAIPIFAPFVLLFAIYTRIAKGPIAIYSVLPISIEPATTRLAKLFWQVIYWVPDQDSVKAFKDYEASLQAIVSTATTAVNNSIAAAT